MNTVQNYLSFAKENDVLSPHPGSKIRHGEIDDILHLGAIKLIQDSKTNSNARFHWPLGGTNGQIDLNVIKSETEVFSIDPELMDWIDDE